MARGAKRARVLVACAAGALASFVALGMAEAQTNRTATQAERDRRAETARAERLRNQAAEIRREVNALDGRLAESARRRAEAEAAAAAAELRLVELQSQIDSETLRQRRARDAFEAALMTAAFAERRAEPRVVRAGIFAAAAAPSLRREERRSVNAAAIARHAEAQVAEERIVLAEAQVAIDAERAELAALMTRRRAAQAQLANDAVAAERRARTFAAEARTLRDLAQRVQQASTRRTSPAPGPSVIPAAWGVPAQGRVVRAYGARDGQGPAAQGVTLSTRAGAQVLAPAAAEVAYADAFRGYGNVLILNLDGGYVLVLTGLETIRARVGETVRAGQPVGDMPASGATTDIAAPELYVEVRRNGEPVDPGRWLSGRQTAGRGVQAG